MAASKDAARTHYPDLVSATVVNGDLPNSLADQLSRETRVAVDTETTGLDWQRDTLELCQIWTDTTGPILIRRSQGRPVNLLALLENPTIEKVFHFAPFDLRFLEAAWGVRVSPVFCTKAASKLLEPTLPSAEHSLGALLRRHFGLHLDKGAVRVSDWGTDELSPRQIAYAAADVSSLLRLASFELEQLRLHGLDGDFRTICAYMPVDAHLEIAGTPNPLAY